MNPAKNKRIYGFFILLSVFVIVFLLLAFSASIERFTESSMRTYLEEIRDNAIFMLNNEIEGVTNLLQNEARAFSLLEDPSPEDIVAELQTFSGNNAIVRAAVITRDGWVYSGVGEPVRQYDITPYEESLNLQHIVISEPRYSDALGKNVVAVTVPLYLHGERDGILMGEYDFSYFENLFSKNFLKGDCAINLATAGGQLISRSGAFAAPAPFGKGSIFDFYRRDDVFFHEGSPEKLEQQMKNGESGYAAYETEGVSRYLSYAPVGINDWYIAAVTTEATLGTQVTVIRKNAFWMVAGIAGVVLVTALAITLLRLREERQIQAYLLKMAQTDALTGLRNKTATADAIDAYLKGDGAAGQHMLLMLDIDGFKEVNDRLGHLRGDEVLREFGTLLRNSFGPENILGRAGGDEFMAFMKNCGDRQTVVQRAAHICEAFDTLHCPEEKTGSPCARTSVSVGIAAYPGDGQDFDTLYHSADTALYESKRKGKNQYNFYKNKDSSP